jgi:two-component system chemotaxis sensor kinase CheA
MQKVDPAALPPRRYARHFGAQPSAGEPGRSTSAGYQSEEAAVTFEEIITEIGTALNRFACDRIVAGDGAVPARTVLLAQAERLDDVGSPAARDLSATLRALAESSAADRDTLEAALAIVDRVRPTADGPDRTAVPPQVTPAGGTGAANEIAFLQDDPEMADLFIGEALDHLGTIEAALLSLEERPGDVGLLNDIFRPFHTIKGNAGALGIVSVQDVAHRVENLLDLARSGRHQVGATEVDLVLRAVDVLTLMITDIGRRLKGQPAADLDGVARALVENVEHVIAGGPADAAGLAHEASSAPAVAHEGPSAPAAPAPSPRPEAGRRFDDLPGQAAIKVDTRKLDNLVDAVGELIIVQALIQEDPALAALVDGKLARSLGQLKRITAELQRGAMGLRMVPVRQAFQKVSRVVRDLSRNTGKPVELVLSGEDTELDRKVVEDITDPLMHMVRNSVDHGIEAAAVREAAGKRAQGRVSLSAYHQGGHIVLEIADDGAGLDTERIRRKAIERGLVEASATPPPEEINMLIFAPGFSTAEKVTEISGRGVGMDVVRRNIEALRGRIEIKSERGRGTTFLIKLPLTLAVLDGLLVAIGRERFVLPTNVVRESLRPKPEQVHTVAGQPRMVQVRNTLVPLVFLGELFGYPCEADPCRATVVMIEDEGRQVGVVVDRLLSKQEVVIKSLGETFSAVRGVAGGAILGDGRIGLILDAHGIVELMRGDRRAA